jgi:MFS family permease
LIGVTFATSPILLFISAFVLGFFLTSAMPVIMQYTAEVTHPTPEGTSNGLIQLFGQASVVFVFLMEALKNSDGSFTPALLVAAGFLIVSLFFISQMKDPQELVQQ